MILSYFKIGGAALGLALIGYAGWAISDRADLRDRLAACTALAAGKNDGAACPAKIADPIRQAAAAAACDKALAGAPRQQYAADVIALCSPSVRREAVAREAAEASYQSAAAQLTQQSALTAQAVARAEARAGQQQILKEKADAVIKAAPRIGDRVSCDAACLRALVR